MSPISKMNNNGHPHYPDQPPVMDRPPDPLTMEQLKIQARRLHLENRVRQENITRNVLEALWFDDFGGSDEFYRLRMQSGGLPVPLTTPSDRRGGTKWPLWRTEQELAKLRQESRINVDSNSYGKGLLRNLTNHIIGVGYNYKATRKARLPLKYRSLPKELIQKWVEEVQEVLDEFTERNHWNTSSGSVTADEGVKPSREREAFRRTYRDGEAFIRFFFHGDGDMRGKTSVRFDDPECIAQPPGKTFEMGWSLGRKHKIEPYEDLEVTEAWYVKYHNVAVENEEQTASPLGTIVPAREMVQIKLPDEDAEVARGTPAFCWEVGAALKRAARIQRYVSETAGERARTAEIWKHVIGTQSQVMQLAQGLAAMGGVGGGSSPNINPSFNQAMPWGWARSGGMTRRIPQGQEPVNPPKSTGVEEHYLALQGDLRQVGTAFSAPEYMVSSDASNSNYSSTKEAGTPFVRGGESDQEHFKGAFLCCVWKAIRWAVECKLLPEEILYVVDIRVEAVQITKEKAAEVASQNNIYIQNRVKSPQTVQLELGLDPDTEAHNWEMYDQQEMKRQSLLALTNPGGNGATPPPKPQQKPGTPQVPTPVEAAQQEKDATVRESLAIPPLPVKNGWVTIPDRLLF